MNRVTIQRAPGIAEVARRAGVSIATVSNALNGSKYVSPVLRRRVEEAVRRLHYRPDSLAIGLRRRRTRVLGLLVSDIANPFYTELARAIEDRAAGSGYQVVLGNTDEDVHKQREYLDVFLALHVAGLIVAPAGGRGGDIDGPVRRGVPMVFVNRRIPGLRVPAVTCDNRQGAYLATAHLLTAGHRRIGLLRPDWLTSTIAERTAGYRRALAERECTYDPRLVRTGSATRSAAAELTEGLLTLPSRPTAMLVLSSAMVEGVLDALQRRRLACPEDLALIVYNDQRLAEFVAPPLTCVTQPTRDMGVTAVEMILAAIDGRRPVSPVPLAPGLVVRRSCGCGAGAPRWRRAFRHAKAS
jgi:DNA-binding LacI/PurR family transcriptional regulator